MIPFSLLSYPNLKMITIDERAVAPTLALHNLLETIVSSIARKTSNPKIEHLYNDALFTLQVDPHDQGRFIGKLGATIWGIQTIFWYAGLTQFGWSYSVKLLEPENPIHDRRPVPVKFNPDWDRKKIEKLISEIISTCLRSFASYSLLETSDTNLIVNLKLLQYLRINLSDPDFVEAFETVARVAGMSNGVQIKTEAMFE